MAETLRGGLSFGLSGGAFWSHDISGFNDTASPALYKRWLAFGRPRAARRDLTTPGALSALLG